MKRILVVVAIMAALIGVGFWANLGTNVSADTQVSPVITQVPVVTPNPTPMKTYGPPIPEVIYTPAPSVAPITATSISTQVEKEWWEPFVQETASLLYEEVLGTCLDNKEQVATFAWVIRMEDLEKLVEGDEYVELTQHVSCWNEYSLPQNSLGVLSVMKDDKPEGWVSKMAGSFAPETSVSEEGILQKWRVGISSDAMAMKVVEFDYDPMVIVLRKPDEVTGQRYFLVIDGKENKPVQTQTSSGGGSNSGSSKPEATRKPESTSKPTTTPDIDNPVITPTTTSKPIHAVDTNTTPNHAADGNSASTTSKPNHANDSSDTGSTSGGNGDGHGVAVGAPSF